MESDSSSFVVYGYPAFNQLMMPFLLLSMPFSGSAVYSVESADVDSVNDSRD